VELALFLPALASYIVFVVKNRRQKRAIRALAESMSHA
jgi:hypothetical protein